MKTFIFSSNLASNYSRLSSPSKLRREGIEKFLDKQVPENNRGSSDWDIGK